MRGRLFSVLSALSLALLVITCALWVQSYLGDFTLHLAGQRCFVSSLGELRITEFVQAAGWTPNLRPVPVRTVFIINEANIVVVCLDLLILRFCYYWWFERKQKKVVPGLCATCGYDLRATPGRCLECEMVAQKEPAGISSKA